MKLHTVTMQLCEDCLTRGIFNCETKGCYGAAETGAMPCDDPNILQLDGYAMCCACKTQRACRVVEPGTDDERQYCKACWDVTEHVETVLAVDSASDVEVNTWTADRGMA